MSGSASGTPPPGGKAMGTPDKNVLNSVYQKAALAAEIRARAHLAAQQAMLAFPEEAGLSWPVSHSAASSSATSKALTMAAPSSSSMASVAANAGVQHRHPVAGPGHVQPPGFSTPKRKRQVQSKPEDTSSEDEAVWKCASQLSTSPSPSSVSLASPLGRLQMAQSPGSVGVPVAEPSAAQGLPAAATPVMPIAGGVENDLAPTEVDSSEDEGIDDAFLEDRPSPKPGSSRDCVGRTGAVLHEEPEDTSNRDCSSSMSETPESPSVDTPTLMYRMLRHAELEAALEDLENSLSESQCRSHIHTQIHWA